MKNKFFCAYVESDFYIIFNHLKSIILYPKLTLVITSSKGKGPPKNRGALSLTSTNSSCSVARSWVFMSSRSNEKEVDDDSLFCWCNSVSNGGILKIKIEVKMKIMKR